MEIRHPEWKFCAQKMENFPDAMESLLFHDFLRQVKQFHAATFVKIPSQILESQNPGGTDKSFCKVFLLSPGVLIMHCIILNF